MRGYTYIILVTLVFLLCQLFPRRCASQVLALKSNLMADVLASPNLGVELLASPHWSFDVGIHYQPLGWGTHRWKHWIGYGEARRWLCAPFSGAFYGFHLLCGQFNTGGVHLPFGLFEGLRDSRYEGWSYGGGVSYGYQYVLSPRWSLEGTLGLGMVLLRYDRYRCRHCGMRTGSNLHKTYFGPTRAALSLVYMLR